MRTITLADSTKLNASLCGKIGDKLTIAVQDLSRTVAEMLELFTDKTRTCDISCDYGGGIRSEFHDYTEMIAFDYRPLEATFTITMRQPQQFKMEV